MIQRQLLGHIAYPVYLETDEKGKLAINHVLDDIHFVRAFPTYKELIEEEESNYESPT